jgi:hypothetical protein
MTAETAVHSMMMSGGEIFVGIDDGGAVIGGAESADESGLRASLVMVQDVHVEPVLYAHHCGEQSDRTRAGDQERLRTPFSGTAADPLDMLPRLGQNARGLQQKHPGAATQGRS